MNDLAGVKPTPGWCVTQQSFGGGGGGAGGCYVSFTGGTALRLHWISVMPLFSVAALNKNKIGPFFSWPRFQ